ncbi:hypothetical protein EMIT0P12_20336 [Pseudomonas sp. IT-P12]
MGVAPEVGHYPLNASTTRPLFAKAEGQSRWMLADPPPSRAGSLPQRHVVLMAQRLNPKSGGVGGGFPPTYQVVCVSN